MAAGLYVDDDDAEMMRTNEIKSEDEEESYYSESEEGMESEDYDTESHDSSPDSDDFNDGAQSVQSNQNDAVRNRLAQASNIQIADIDST